MNKGKINNRFIRNDARQGCPRWCGGFCFPLSLTLPQRGFGASHYSLTRLGPLFSLPAPLLKVCVTPYCEQVSLCHFSNSIFSLCVSVLHIGISPNIFSISLLLYSLWWHVIRDLGCYPYDLLKAQMMVSIFFLEIKCFLIKLCAFL